MARRIAVAVMAIAVIAGACGGEPSLDEHVCSRLADGASEWEIAQDLARDVDGDDSTAGARSWLRGSVLPAAQSC